MTDATETLAPDAEGAHPADQLAGGHDPSELVDRMERLSELTPSDDVIAARGERYLTWDELTILSDQVSMSDTWRATEASRAEFPDDPDLARRKAGMLVFLYVAQRIGMADADDTFDGFLARIRQDDFVELMTGKGRTGK